MSTNKINNKLEKKSIIPLQEIIENSIELREVWTNFHHIIRNNVKNFYKTNIVKKIVVCSLEKKDYLIIKLHNWDYLILDTFSERYIGKEEVSSLFNESFFIENFGEERKAEFPYLFINSCRNPKEILDFFVQYKSFLLANSVIQYQWSEKENFLSLDFDTKNNFLGLEIFSKESPVRNQYFFDCNLYPLNYQYLEDNLGKKEALEILKAIQNLSIPYQYIPEEYLKNSTIRKRVIS